MEKYLTKPEAAAFFGVSRSTFDRYRRKPDFPKVYSKGGKSVWHSMQLREWGKKHRIVPVND